MRFMCRVISEVWVLRLACREARETQVSASSCCGNPPPECGPWSGHIVQGHIVQSSYFPRDGRSKGWNVQELSFGDISIGNTSIGDTSIGDTMIGDTSSWHRWFLPLVTSHTPMAGRGGTSGTFAAKSSTLFNKRYHQAVSKYRSQSDAITDYRCRVLRPSEEARSIL